ncbi:MAG TPA: replication-associated recombination protein A, partial [Acidimicrobiales bacterium]|nr:replication-associated recombination protein A [Acidimicrobiales bacterium]
IGATTENPFFALNTPLLSRSTLWRFEALDQAAVVELVERGLEIEGVTATEEAVRLLADLASGDARVALTVLEVAAALARATSTEKRPIAPPPTASHERPAPESKPAQPRIGTEEVEQARAMRAFRHGREEHYNLISALIKAIRGSDPDGALYWLARILEVGEDPRYVGRRLVILASEDVGLADPMALVIADAAAHAVEVVGMPEAALNLAQAAVHLALAPKSNSAALGIWAAQELVRNGPFLPVPEHLRDSHYRGAASLGHGIGYEYPHDDPRGWVDQAYLPDELAEARIYVPREHGAEGTLVRRWRERRSETNKTSESTETTDTRDPRD